MLICKQLTAACSLHQFGEEDTHPSSVGEKGRALFPFIHIWLPPKHQKGFLVSSLNCKAEQALHLLPLEEAAVGQMASQRIMLVRALQSAQSVPPQTVSCAELDLSADLSQAELFSFS